MEEYTTKDAKDYAQCVYDLRKKEAKDGLRRDRKNGIMRDYSLSKYDGDPLVEEYRQLAKLRHDSKNNGGSDDDPMDSPETSRQPAQGTLSPGFKKKGNEEKK